MRRPWGGPQPQFKTVVKVWPDLSGKDWGTTPYKEPSIPLSGNLQPDDKNSPPKIFPKSWIASDRVDARLLRELDKGQSLVVRGQMVSLVPYLRGTPFDHYTNFILSLKVEKIAVDHP
jgi:hypothetical protein